MSHIEIPLSPTESVEVRITPPDQSTAQCRACGVQTERCQMYRVTGIVHSRTSTAILRTEECYACSERCARAIYREERA